jgi:succinyl-CoA synthetase alpha subunit/RimJ/RimL family protein N-acetyltransferase
VPAETALWQPCDVVLSDGSIVHLRPIEPSDADALVRFHEGLSERSVYLRFFNLHRHLSESEVRRFTCVDGSDRAALIATHRDEMVAVARYDRDKENPEQAEAAFVVGDEYQGRGLGTLLLEHLAAYARRQGIRRFLADTLPENLAMQRLFRDAGFDEVATFGDGVVKVRLELEPSEFAIGAIDDRWSRAAARSVARVLEPESVAVVGAGRSRGGIGHEIVRNIVSGGFEGAVYPINPTARSVASIPAYPSLLDVPVPIDLAIIAVPNDQVLSVVGECAVKGVGALVVVSSGFAETGPEGRKLQEDLLRTARAAGIRVVGPNCLGIINTAPGISLNATFALVAPAPGRVAFSSQSGALGIAVLEEAQRRNIGLSSFVSVGNKCDVSGNDLLQYWQEDPATDVILLYLESFGNPRRFARVARSVSRRKPIIAVKAGRSRPATGPPPPTPRLWPAPTSRSTPCSASPV